MPVFSRAAVCCYWGWEETTQTAKTVKRYTPPRPHPTFGHLDFSLKCKLHIKLHSSAARDVTNDLSLRVGPELLQGAIHEGSRMNQHTSWLVRSIPSAHPMSWSSLLEDHLLTAKLGPPPPYVTKILNRFSVQIFPKEADLPNFGFLGLFPALSLEKWQKRKATFTILPIIYGKLVLKTSWTACSWRKYKIPKYSKAANAYWEESQEK